MGVLKGSVDILGLGTLFQGLAMNGREGTLTVQRQADRKSLYFGPHGVRFFATTMKRVNRLGSILLRGGKVTPDGLRGLLEEQKLLGFRLGQIAINSGKITRQDLEAALHEQIEEEIFDLFMWTEAEFEFVEGPPRKPSGSSPLAEYTLDLNVTHLVLEAARRADELSSIRRLLSDDGMILKRNERKVKAADMADDQRTVASVLPLIDGRRTVLEIVQKSVYPRFATMRALYRLLLHEYVRIRSGRSVGVMPSVPPRGKA